MPQPVPGSLVITDFSRGWDPTHPDEQLIGANLAPGAQFSASTGAPFMSPDVHDVDFWNGYLNKRNGKTKIGPAIGAGNIISLFTYLFTNITGTSTRRLMAFFGAWPYYFNGATWTQLLNASGSGTIGTNTSFFASLKNLLFITYNAINNTFGTGFNLPPQWWDGNSVYMGFHGMRMSPLYMAFFGLAGNCKTATIASISGNTLTMNSNQPASGLFRGKQIYVYTSVGLYEPAQISSFSTTGTQGTANYYVTSITLVNSLRYVGVFTYDGVIWNGGTIVAASTGGHISITGTLTCIRVLAITNLNSGGQRCSEYSVDVPAGTTGLIELSNIPMAYGDGQLFQTDIPENATTWYMSPAFDPQLVDTDPNGGLSQLFYLIPDNKGTATDTSTGYNPMPNATTAFNILTGRNPNTDVTLVANTAVDAQGYFTGQVDVPYYQFMVAWQDFLVLCADIWNQSAIWITAYGAPQVIGTQGGLDGAFIQIPNGNDGQIILAAYVWRGDLYIFKTNSVYIVQFAGPTSLSPFVVTKLQGNYGPVSAKCIAETDTYLTFLSPQGLCAISGLTVTLLPENDQIRAKFIGATAWDISALSLCQATSFPSKRQIWFQVATGTIGDTLLIYDWARRSFWYDTEGIPATALFQDLSLAPSVAYGGDSAGQVWTLDVPGTDEAIPIDMRYETPWLNLGDPTAFKELKWLWLAGAQQQPGNIMHVEIYFDYNLKASRVLDFDMSDLRFQTGLWKAINSKNKYIKLVLTNNDSGTPVSIRYMRLDYVNVGPQL